MGHILLSNDLTFTACHCSWSEYVYLEDSKSPSPVPSKLIFALQLSQIGRQRSLKIRSIRNIVKQYPPDCRSVRPSKPTSLSRVCVQCSTSQQSDRPDGLHARDQSRLFVLEGSSAYNGELRYWTNFDRKMMSFLPNFLGRRIKEDFEKDSRYTWIHAQQGIATAERIFNEISCTNI